MTHEKLGARIVVIGGGTGSFTVLSGLKHYASSITALVNMADDGGSTGVLRDELGALPPGDVRQCLVALAGSEKVRDLFNYRFEEGTLKGHALGNLFLTALEKMTGSFVEAVETASEILRVEGEVVPATLDNVRLKMSWDEHRVTLEGERTIDVDHFIHDPRKAQLKLDPAAVVNPVALRAIEEADMIVIAPGDLYTSLGPILISDPMGSALRKTPARVVYVCNLVTKSGQTNGFTVSDHAGEIQRFIGGKNALDYVLYNTTQPPVELLDKYARDGEYGIVVDAQELKKAPYTAVGVDLLSTAIEGHDGPQEADLIAHTRSYIRHDSDKVARALMKIYFM